MAEYNKGFGFGVDFTASMGQMVSGIANANALRFQGDYQAKVAEMNARFIEMEAKEVIEAGDREASEHGKKINQMVGKQRAAFAAGNIKVDSGTAAQIQQQTREMGYEEQRNIRNNAWRQAFGLQTEAFNAREGGRAARSRSRQQMGATLVTSALGFAKDINESYRENYGQRELFDPADRGKTTSMTERK